jgi:hypothetical protein
MVKSLTRSNYQFRKQKTGLPEWTGIFPPRSAWEKILRSDQFFTTSFQVMRREPEDETRCLIRADVAPAVQLV